jgi:hypothetical protein
MGLISLPYYNIKGRVGENLERSVKVSDELSKLLDPQKKGHAL